MIRESGYPRFETSPPTSNRGLRSDSRIRISTVEDKPADLKSGGSPSREQARGWIPPRTRVTREHRRAESRRSGSCDSTGRIIGAIPRYREETPIFLAFAMTDSTAHAAFLLSDFATTLTTAATGHSGSCSRQC